jgi:hypothetical protein
LWDETYIYGRYVQEIRRGDLFGTSFNSLSDYFAPQTGRIANPLTRSWNTARCKVGQ